MSTVSLKQATQELKQSLNFDGEIRVEKLIQLLQATKNKTDWINDDVSDELIQILRFLLVDRDRQVRVQAARAMRYITYDNKLLLRLNKFNIPILMMRCLEREDNKYLWERMQALKWIRHIMSLPNDITNNNSNKYTIIDVFPRYIYMDIYI